MKLLTKELENKLAKNYEKFDSMDSIRDEKIVVHYFNPYGAGDWYGYSMDEGKRLFGYAKISDGEYGYFSLAELSNLGFIERDMYFDKNK